MSDFAQNGAVCTLQKLNDWHLDLIDAHQLPQAAATSCISVLLPCHASDLSGPALVPLCAELSNAPWLSEILIPINGLPPDAEPHTRSFFQKHLRVPHTLLFTDHPPLLHALARAAGTSPHRLPQGKGTNIWAAIGLLSTRQPKGLLLFQDCDVLSFRRHALARLGYTIAAPDLGFSFAKMYYSRVTDRLYGRVSRLFLAPLLHALIRVAGHHPLLDFLQSFRYPLAGECALPTSLALELPCQPGWALELGMLCDVFRHVPSTHICQVDAGPGYDHKHQPASGNLQRMCTEIATCLLHQLRREGCDPSPPFLNAVSRAFHRESLEAVRRSAALAHLNGLAHSYPADAPLARLFSEALPSALPPEPTPLPSWRSLARSSPEILDALGHVAARC